MVRGVQQRAGGVVSGDERLVGEAALAGREHPPRFRARDVHARLFPQISGFEGGGLW